MSERVLVSVFTREEDILAATRAARAAGHDIVDVHTPYAVHGMDEAMGVRPSRLPWACVALGLLGAGLKFWFQMWTSATSWPVNVGGKPLRSVPAFVPVTFEIMVLFAGIGTVIVFFAISGLRPGRHARVPNMRATDDRFILTLRERDAAFDAAAVGRTMRDAGAVDVEEQVMESAA